ncbi:pyruvate formate lyase activating enzyme [Salirhabdus euzebyi]|uniref:Pyruvate formate-lyase-activating enzyme n=1 Tax=Salirhabdus euzebyi TaxID=394506 RepID=A0A841Q410_9BACI|nr:pyruvate formate-lyase-activating protein [Salirhabdus euzebyi]MBB6453102.1 pyruvate formate lyase activating enzyme [Salirhabdus euzebyi]
MKGRIHSIETFGTLDGPGIRYVIFTQGCLLRCQFCHNPDTWDLKAGKEVTVEEVIKDVEDYIPYMNASGGGITVSGGEPLLQVEFLTELFTECKKRGIHTTIDSSGGCFSTSKVFLEKLDKLLAVTDLILLDLKQINDQKHKTLTGLTNKHILKFAKLLADKKIPIWVRHVLVPGITDNEEDLTKLSAFIHSLSNVEKIEILPYHKLGIYKWENLGLNYPLEGVEPPTKETVEWAQQILETK